MPYSSSLSDKEWEIIEAMLPQKKRTRPLIWSKRQILDGIIYQLKSGCNWGSCPKTYRLTQPCTGTCIQWRNTGVLDKMMAELHAQVCQQAQKNRSGQH